MKKAPPEFVTRIKTKMDTENLGINDLARKIGVSHPTITEIVTYENQPSFNTCAALSSWLGESPEMTMRSAGLLQSRALADEVTERSEHILENYKRRETKERALEYLEFLQVQEEKGEYNTHEKQEHKESLPRLSAVKGQV